MPKILNRNDLLPAVLNGMKASARKWEKIHGTWANQAPEYWFTVNLSQELFRNLGSDKCWIEMEASVKSVLKKSRPRTPGSFRKAVRKDGRLDILIERIGEKPFAAIELKTCTRSLDKPYLSDVRRLKGLLLAKKTNTIKIGCLALYTDIKGYKDKNDKKSRGNVNIRLRSIFDKLISGAKNECLNTGLIIKHKMYIFSSRETFDRWGILCISFQRS